MAGKKKLGMPPKGMGGKKMMGSSMPKEMPMRMNPGMGMSRMDVPAMTEEHTKRHRR